MANGNSLIPTGTGTTPTPTASYKDTQYGFDPVLLGTHPLWPISLQATQRVYSITTGRLQTALGRTLRAILQSGLMRPRRRR